jgi:hypothetical protein
MSSAQEPGNARGAARSPGPRLPGLRLSSA